MKGSLRVIALTALLAAGLASTASAFHGERVYIANRCDGHAYKPWGVIIACGDGNLYSTGIRFATYGGKLAVARATIHANGCFPNCAVGHFHTYAGTLRFKDIVRCDDDRLYYSVVQYRFPGPHGIGYGPIAPIEAECSRILG